MCLGQREDSEILQIIQLEGYSLMTACPYMRIKSVILIKLWCFTDDRNTRLATATTETERGVLCAYFIYIKTDINE